MTREARQFRCPENVLGWIPWYADGGLSAQQKGQVEAHAAECSDCRAELDIVAGAPFEIDMVLPDPDRLFREITERIDAGERDASSAVLPVEPSNPGDRKSTLNAAELDRIGRWVLDPSTEETDETADSETDPGEVRADARIESSRVLQGPWSRERIAIVAAAAALAILFLGGIGGALLSSLGSGGLDRPGRFELADNIADTAVATTGDLGQGLEGGGAIYHSATVASEGAVAESVAPMLDVVFLDTVSVREVSDALREVGVEIVSGPSSLGVYRVRMTSELGGGRVPTAADVAAIANRLKASGSAVAIFAEAVP